MKILIAGGGISGLALATFLVRAGIDCHVFEQVPEYRRVGQTITLAPNGLDVLDMLGAFERVARSGRLVERVLVTDIRGALLRETHIAPLGRMLSIHRADVIADLLAGVRDHPRFRLTHGARVVRWDEDAAGVTVHFSNGESARGDALIGADGIQSTVRAGLFGAEEMNTFRLGCVYAITRFPETDPVYRNLLNTFSFVLGPGDGRSGICTHIADGQIGWSFMFRREAPANTANTPADPALIETICADLGDPYRTVARRVDFSESVVLQMRDKNVLPSWSKGRVAIMGDAAHPMLPTIGQGANQCLEDAYVLGALLTSPGLAGRPVPELLALYGSKRIPRSSAAVHESRATLKRTANFPEQPLLRAALMALVTAMIKYAPHRLDKIGFDRWRLLDYGYKPAVATT